MNELDFLFSDLSLEEAEELLKNINVKNNKEINAKIKENLSLKEKNKVKAFPLRKYFPLAAALFAAVIALSIAVNTGKRPVVTTTQPTTTSATATPSLSTELLKKALGNGNDSLVLTMLSSAPSFFSDEIISFAVSCADFISYNTLHEIVTAVLSYRGGTGLDSLLESTLSGNSKRALEELKKRDNMLMTPLERLSFFFAVAFCDSEVVDEYINKGYDVNITNALGESLYEIAEKYNNEDNMKYLNQN